MVLGSRTRTTSSFIGLRCRRDSSHGNGGGCVGGFVTVVDEVDVMVVGWVLMLMVLMSERNGGIWELVMDFWNGER